MHTKNHNNNTRNYNPPPSGPDGTGDSTGPVRVKAIFKSLAILNFLQVNMEPSAPASTLPMSSPATGLVTGNVDYLAKTSSNYGDIDILLLLLLLLQQLLLLLLQQLLLLLVLAYYYYYYYYYYS